MATAGQAKEIYRGFTIDASALAKETDLPVLLAATKEQIDMVEAVGLSPDVLAFLQTVKLQLVPAGTFKGPTPGRYKGRQDQSVQITAAIARIGGKPVLLHELMHALHDQRIGQGFKNPEILGLYKQARAVSAYAARSHMMSNEKEYFACTATAYLFGVTAQEPFNREKLRLNQHDCYDFLKKLFGPDAGSYVGSLSP